MNAIQWSRHKFLGADIPVWLLLPLDVCAHSGVPAPGGGHRPTNGPDGRPLRDRYLPIRPDLPSLLPPLRLADAPGRLQGLVLNRAPQQWFCTLSATPSSPYSQLYSLDSALMQ